jgi:hypothetical protein
MSREQAAAGAFIGVRGAEGGCMLARSELAPILDDEALTRQLGDAEARVLIEWLVDQAEGLPADQARLELSRLCRRARTMARFVRLWCQEQLPGAAAQLAAAERLDWPLPDGPLDPCLLMVRLVSFENQRAHRPGDG